MRSSIAIQEVHMRCEECGVRLWQAGEVVPPGIYMRVDDETHPVMALDQAGPLPASLDGRVALYHLVAPTYTCPRCGRHGACAGDQPRIA
jgi:hypothetical protein